jgi:hypothetical protein
MYEQVWEKIIRVQEQKITIKNKSNANMTMATMNMFQYYHYMTKFIEVLAEKHGYDAEVMQNEWRSLNAKWMTETKQTDKMTTEFITEFMNVLVQKHGYDKEVMQSTWQSVTAVPRKRILPPSLRPSPVAEKPKKEKMLCSYIFENGKKKGQTCGTWVRNPDEISCAKHTEKKLYDAKKTQIFTHLVKAFENLSTSHGGTFAELVYDADTGYPIIKYKFPTKVANFLKTVPKEVFEEFAHDQKIAKKEDKVEQNFESTWCDCHKYN